MERRRVSSRGECGEEAVKERRLSGWRLKGDVSVGKDDTRPKCKIKVTIH